MGDHLRKAGMGCWLVGKTHMEPDTDGMDRLGIAPDSKIGRRLSECGFDVFERDDGMLPHGPDGYYDLNGAQTYNAYLNAKGYEGDNPWHDYANSGLDADGNVQSGWFLKNSSLTANIAEEDSETPYMTRRGMEFIEQAEGPWCCHLSLIKPHWPYVAPAPYADMYGLQDLLPTVRTQEEFDTAHPVLKIMMQGDVGATFSRDDTRNAVIPAYMGLIKQIDDQMGVLFNWLEETGRMEDTMIVVTSDHGDYLGDHWLGEKQFFYDTSARVPLIIYDPSPEADATRGTVSDALVESIDLPATFLDVAGGEAIPHVMEGRSLLPILHGQATEMPRDYVICEYDYSGSGLASRLGVPVENAQIFMVATKKWKLIHFDGGFRPILFDLENDPQELVDLAEDAAYASALDEMYAHLHQWALRPSARITRSEAQLIKMRIQSARTGVVLGAYDEADIDPELVQHYVGRKARPWQETVKQTD
jgi:arylsulfatase A-like enzyme